jgi:hypothetical protein
MLLFWGPQKGSTPPVPDPIAISDFKNGVYSIGGVNKTLAQMWVGNPDWEAYDPASVVAGVGLTVTGSPAGYLTQGPVANAELLAVLGGGPGEFVCVAEYEIESTGTGNPYIYLFSVDLPDFNAAWLWVDQPGASPRPFATLVGDFDVAAAGFNPGANGVKKAAFMFCDTGLALSVNGSAPVVSAAPQAIPGANAVGITVAVHSDGVGVGTATIRKLTFYPNTDNPAILPILSA